MTEFVERRRDPNSSVKEYFHSPKQIFDPQTGRNIVKIFSGDWHVSGQGKNEMLTTILGSCVSACIRDPLLGVGGMNHFLLPGSDSVVAKASDEARYGVFAMENLINGILKAGGDKSRLEVKVFGGGNVTKNNIKIGSKNSAFVRDFLKREGFKITSEDLEGELPRRIHYFPDTGKVLMRKLQRKEDMVVVDEEAQYKKSIVSKPIEGDIDLF